MDANHTMTAVFNNSVQFTVPQFNVSEAELPPCTNPGCGASVTVTVSRRGSTAASASVDYTTSDDVATQKGDYIFSAGRLNFAVGEASKSFTVFIVDDVYQEGTEKFKVMLSNPVGTTLGVRSVADVAIFDDDLSRRQQTRSTMLTPTFLYESITSTSSTANRMPVDLPSGLIKLLPAERTQRVRK